MTNANKINSKQKQVMAEFMLEHSNLARNKIPNCAQGKATSKRLWDQLAVKLNICGPPVKEAKIWKKVFADQKFQAKKKLSFNKASKKKTGGGPYEEIFISSADEQIIQATGIDETVEGLVSVESFGANKTPENVPDEIEELQLEFGAELDEPTEKWPHKPKTNTKHDAKLNLLKSHFESYNCSQLDLSSKLDHLIALKERSLKIKEDEHTINMQIKEVELKLKSLQLDVFYETHAFD